MKLKETIGAVAGVGISIMLFPKIENMDNGLILRALQLLGLLVFISLGVYVLKLRLKARSQNGSEL